ncbi:MAG: hypothetical protein ABI639_17150 [Thermoanaerobaculia bacterium]
MGGFAQNSLHVDEHGHYLIEPGKTWTGTAWDGTATTSTCAAWTDSSSALDATFGFATKAVSVDWTEGDEQNCDELGHLYCISNKITIFWDGFDIGIGTERWSVIVP